MTDQEKERSTAIKQFTAIALVASLLVSVGVHAQGNVVLWNKLGSNQEVTKSEIGRDLEFYSHAVHGGSSPWGEAKQKYVEGVFGNGVTIGPDNYSCCQRIRNLVLTDLNSVISPERGTIEVWFKHDAMPVGYRYGVYRIFDGSFGLDARIELQVGDRLYFAISPFHTVSHSDGKNGYDISLLTGSWIHIAAVWDRGGIDGSSDALRLYIDGEVVASSANSGWINSFGDLADIAGGNDAEIAEKFILDNLVIWDYAKTDFSDRFYEAPGPGQRENVAGMVTGFFPETVDCTNATTGQSVPIVLPAGTFEWDCEAEGLIANAGDQISININGAMHREYDYNADGCIDIADARLVVGESQRPEPHDLSYDVNEDGIVSIADARALVLHCDSPRCVPCN